EEGWEFGLPKASEVHKWWIGDTEKEKALFSSAAFIESPLAVKTLFSAGQYKLTGDEKVKEV
ncbi:unnamed protein product, partial [marine sediment metagenome]